MKVSFREERDWVGSGLPRWRMCLRAKFNNTSGKDRREEIVFEFALMEERGKCVFTIGLCVYKKNSTCMEMQGERRQRY